MIGHLRAGVLPRGKPNSLQSEGLVRSLGIPEANGLWNSSVGDRNTGREILPKFGLLGNETAYISFPSEVQSIKCYNENGIAGSVVDISATNDYTPASAQVITRIDGYSDVGGTTIVARYKLIESSFGYSGTSIYDSINNHHALLSATDIWSSTALAGVANPANQEGYYKYEVAPDSFVCVPLRDDGTSFADGSVLNISGGYTGIARFNAQLYSAAFIGNGSSWINMDGYSINSGAFTVSCLVNLTAEDQSIASL